MKTNMRARIENNFKGIVVLILVLQFLLIAYSTFLFSNSMACRFLSGTGGEFICEQRTY